MSFLNIWTLITFHVYTCISNKTPSDGHVPPNIIVIMMDDLGFTDTSINGGAFPMVTLNELATNGIKLNYHYSNTLCSASRSSLLTGRYAWRTGVVNIIKPLTLQHTNMDLPFISQLLKQSDPPYHTAMYGKYHLGYSSQDYLPFNRGFDETLFFEAGAMQYSSHQACNPWFWALKGIPIDNQLRTLLMSKFIDGFCGYDLWDEQYNKIENNIYSEKLYTHNIIKYINDKGHSNPFFIYYAMQTPHWPLEEPPKLYTECKGHDRKIFCNALLYGDEMIGEIVNNLKQNELYEDTVIMFLSDNGPNTNWANKGFGQSLPLRGAKGTTFEGGIRTPAILSGGYVERYCDVGRSYDDLVHISDWYPMIKHVAGIESGDGEDIDGVDIWQNICFNDANAVKRENIMHFAMNDATDETEGFGPSYIRTDKWKLAVNASLRYDGNVAYEYWVNYDNEFKTNPPKKIFERMIAADEGELYWSECYSAYIDPNFHHANSDMFLDIDFGYDEIMLFKMDEDKIEACNVAQFYPNVVRNLYDTLFSDDNIEQYAQYQIDASVPSKQGALAQIESYDCDMKKAYHLSWEERDGYDVEDAVADMSWNDIFSLYVDVVDGCNMGRHNKQKSDNQQMMALMMMISLILSIIFILRYYFSDCVEHAKVVRNISDVTPLLSVSQT